MIPYQLSSNTISSISGDGSSPGTYTPTLRVRMMCSQHGPLRVTTKYWLSTLPEGTPLAVLVDTIKMRWRIERDYEELKSELGLAHFEGRGWRGFHHHASLCIAAYGFLILERSAFPPSARWRRERPALSGRGRSSFAADPSRKTRGQLDRDDAKAFDDRAGKIAPTMPVLSRRLATTELPCTFVTQ